MDCGIFLLLQVPKLECNDHYIEEAAKTFGRRFKDHPKAPLPLHGQQTTIDPLPILDKFSIVGSEGQGFAKTIIKSIIIRLSNPIYSSNRNVIICMNT